MSIQLNENTNPQPSEFSSTRPFIVTLLVAEVLILTGLNGFRSLEAFRHWDYQKMLWR